MRLEHILLLLLALQIVGLVPLILRYFWSIGSGIRLDTVWLFLGRARKTILMPGGIVLSIGWFPLGNGIEPMQPDEDSVMNENPMTYRQKFWRYLMFYLLIFPGFLLVSAGMLSISFFWQGEHARTIQVTNLVEGDVLAKSLGIGRGDILLSVNGVAVKSFDGALQSLKDWDGHTVKSLLWEKKTQWLEFDGAAAFREYLLSRYRDGQYIRISGQDRDDALFYAVPEAIKHLQSMNPKGLRYFVSSDAEQYTVHWQKGSAESLGIGVKPYTLPGKARNYTVFESLSIGLGYTYSLTALLLISLWESFTNFGDSGGLNSIHQLIFDLSQFVSEVSSMELLSQLRTLSILCIFFAILNVLPLPGLAMWSIIKLVAGFFKIKSGPE